MRRELHRNSRKAHSVVEEAVRRHFVKRYLSLQAAGATNRRLAAKRKNVNNIGKQSVTV
jgi:hypothetical protein